jgi:hypothetical protein
MKQLVIMPGGFHPFHAGHAALYQSAVEAFPGADVYVAATNDTSTRPFPFPVKEKLAQLAGVPKGRFTQVKSPFRAEEIVHKYNPDNTQLIFVRSEKDAGSQPRPGGTKKDGTPSYLQPYDDASDQPLSQRAYMAYLPTVEFGPGMTSATEIRGAWPTLNEKRKTALVMSLYPKTQTNPKLAATVVKLLDTAMGVVDESALDNLPRPNKRNQFKSIHKQRKQRGLDEVDAQNFVGGMTAGYQRRENQPVDENQGWAATYEALKPDAFAALQQAKQRNAQNRQQEVDQWAQDFQANSSKLAGRQLKQRLAAPPPAPIPVARPGEGFYALKDRLAQLDIAKQKFEEFNRLIASIKKKYPLVADTLDTLENSLLQDVKDGAADNYASLLTKLGKYETALTTRFPGIVKEDPDYIDEYNNR